MLLRLWQTLGIVVSPVLRDKFFLVWLSDCNLRFVINVVVGASTECSVGFMIWGGVVARR
jgi:hypothetical protein